MRPLLFFPILLLSLSPTEAQDILHLPSDQRLTGELREITEAGSLTLQPVHSASPITVEKTTPHRVEFPAHTGQLSHGSEQITLTNGDTIFCELLSLDAQSLTFKTKFAGEFSVKRDCIQEIQFHSTARSNQTLAANDWIKTKQNTSWTATKESLTCLGTGEISQKLKLPLNFIVRYSAQWTGGQPHFKIYLCADSGETGKISECYYIEFSQHSVDLFRSTQSQPHKKIGNIPIVLRHQKDSTIALEIRVDRKTQQLSVSIDGQDAAIFSDPELTSASGDFIIIGTKMPQNHSLSVSDFEILKWQGDLLSAGSFSTDDLDETVDTLVDKEGLSFTGRLDAIVSEKGSKLLLFDSVGSKNVLQVPTDLAKTIYLKKQLPASSPSAQPYTISLGEKTTLTLSSLKISTQGSASAMHPLLGSLSFQSSALKELSLTPTATHE